MSESPLKRRAARVLLLDPDDRVLLFRGVDPGDHERGEFWFTPGGGLDDGESYRQAAVRELAEEVGLDLSPDALSAPVHERVNVFTFDRRTIEQHEVYFVARAPHAEVDSAGFNELELTYTRGHRWWTLAELHASTETVHPPGIAAMLTAAGVG